VFVFVGNGYYLFSAPSLQCNANDTGNVTVGELEDEVTTDDFKLEIETFSLWHYW
jgi:hypothetical protein